MYTCLCMNYTCSIYVLYMIYTCFIHDLYMFYIWFIHDFGMILACFWDDLGMILGWFWDDFGMISAWFGDYCGVIWGWFLDDVWVIIGVTAGIILILLPSSHHGNNIVAQHTHIHISAGPLPCRGHTAVGARALTQVAVFWWLTPVAYTWPELVAYTCPFWWLRLEAHLPS